jgi:hypothetical protein
MLAVVEAVLAGVQINGKSGDGANGRGLTALDRPTTPCLLAV